MNFLIILLVTTIKTPSKSLAGILSIKSIVLSSYAHRKHAIQKMAKAQQTLLTVHALLHTQAIRLKYQYEMDLSKLSKKTAYCQNR